MKKILPILIIVSYLLFILISTVVEFEPGILIFKNFKTYFREIFIILPFIFILIGLFEVWVKRETIEKHLGRNAGFMGYLWAILLGSVTIGPMLVALPIAYALYRKGASLAIVFTYVGAASVCRIPMTIFEASYLGVAFTVIRYAVSIPLIILSASILGRYLTGKNYNLIHKDD